MGPYRIVPRVALFGAAVLSAGVHARAGLIEDLPQTEVRTSVCFTSQGGCAKYIVDAIDNAHSSIYMMQLFISQREINNALVKARARGVNISVILDRKDLVKLTSRSCEGKKVYIGADEISAAGINVLTDDPPRTAHNKVTIIDDDLVIGGSYNFSKSAERSNIENATFVWSSAYASWYRAEWDRRAKVSEPYRITNCLSLPTHN